MLVKIFPFLHLKSLYLETRLYLFYIFSKRNEFTSFVIGDTQKMLDENNAIDKSMIKIDRHCNMN